MDLIVHELKTELKQEIEVKHQPIQLYAIRPHLYRHLAPSGTIYVELRDEGNNVIETSAGLPISSLPSGNYLHGYIRFYMRTNLRAFTKYNVVLKASGYSFSESAWIGWCNDYDLRKAEATYGGNTGLGAALDLELWSTPHENRRYG
jgi:hypothetical protein